MMLEKNEEGAKSSELSICDEADFCWTPLGVTIKHHIHTAYR